MQDKSSKSSKPPIDPDDNPPPREVPRGQNPVALRKFINTARAARPYHNLAVNLDWLNWALDYLILAENEGFSVSEEYLRCPPGPNPISPEPKVIFWDLDLGRPLNEIPPPCGEQPPEAA